MFDSVAPKLEELGEQYGVPIDFEFIRTGQEGSEDYKTYKKNKDNAKREAEIQKNTEKMDKRRQIQENNKTKLDDYADMLQNEINLFKKEKQEFEKEKQEFHQEKEQYQDIMDMTRASLMAIFKNDPERGRRDMYKQLKEKGIESFQYQGKPDTVLLTKATIASLEEINKNGRKVEGEEFIHQEVIKMQDDRRQSESHQRVVIQDDGPEL